MSAFFKRNTPAAIGFALAIVVSVFLRARAQDVRAVRYPPVSTMYIVNHTLCLAPQAEDGSGICKAAPIRTGASIMLQLPGTPSTWSIVSASPNLTPIGGLEKLPNSGRIDGTSEIYQWHFTAARAGDATLVMREFPPAISGNPAGTFTYTFQVR